MSAVTFATTPGGSVPSRRATILGAPRLIVSLEGRRQHAFAALGGAKSLVLGAREALYVAPDCWLDTWYDSDNAALSVVFSKPRARVLLLRYRIEKDRGRTMRADPASVVFVHTGASSSVGMLLDELAVAADRPGWYAANLVQCLVFHVGEALRAPEPTSAGKALQSYHAACSYVDEHCGGPLSREDVGAAVGVHPSHVSRLFSRFSASSFSEYVNEARVARAVRLLADETKTVAEVAFQCGFSSPSYFTRIFRRRTGRTPVAYKSAASRGVPLNLSPGSRITM